MQSSRAIFCDGCGQTADYEHIARRLKRLENMTRYRPIHVQALFLGAVNPLEEADCLYSAQTELRGEGLALLRAVGIDLTGKPVQAVRMEFQRRGLLCAHVLECPTAAGHALGIQALLENRFAATAARIRRSLKPKKLVLIGEGLDSFGEKLAAELPGTEMLLPEQGRSFRLETLAPGSLAAVLCATVAASL